LPSLLQDEFGIIQQDVPVTDSWLAAGSGTPEVLHAGISPNTNATSMNSMSYSA